MIGGLFCFWDRYAGIFPAALAGRRGADPYRCHSEGCEESPEVLQFLEVFHIIKVADIQPPALTAHHNHRSVVFFM